MIPNRARIRLSAALCAGLVTLLFSVHTSAAQPPQHRAYWESLTGVSYNPLGLVQKVTLGYQYRLYESSSQLFENNFVDVALTPSSSPAYGVVGARLWLQPLSILNLRAQYEVVGYYGTFGHMQSFEDPMAEWSDDDLSELKDQGTNYTTTATRLWLTGQLQAKVGPVAVRNTFEAAKMWADLRDGDRVFYSPLMDYLVEDGGWTMQNTLDVVYILDLPLVIGLRHHVMWAEYSSDVAAEDPNGPAHRLGPLIVWPFLSQETGTIQSGRAVLLLNWYLKNRYRAGEASSQAIPYIGSALILEGDLL